MIKDLSEYMQSKEVHKSPISIQFTASQKKRWDEISYCLKQLNGSARISDFARECLYKMMDELDVMIRTEIDKKSAAG